MLNQMNQSLLDIHLTFSLFDGHVIFNKFVKNKQ